MQTSSDDVIGIIYRFLLLLSYFMQLTQIARWVFGEKNANNFFLIFLYVMQKIEINFYFWFKWCIKSKMIFVLFFIFFICFFKCCKIKMIYVVSVEVLV